MKSQTLFALSLFLVFDLAVNCMANPVQWPSANGGNGHSYLAVALTDPILWPDANDMANLLGGHLVTLTSPEENDFVFHLIDHKKYWYPGYNLRGPWTGGYQLPGANEPAGGWSWITGESFAFEIWEPGQPNNMGTNENRIHFGNKLQRVQTWNDVAFNFNQVKSYIVEFPDPKRAPAKWSVREGGNDHPYLAVAAPDGVTWTQANRIANSVGGYLATITSAKENDFINKLVQDDIYWVRLAENITAGPWIGGNQHSDSTESAGGWRWVNDEPMTYTNWGPRKSGISQDAKSNNNGLHLVQLTSGGESTIVWNGMPDSYAGIHGYVIEFPPGEPLPEFEGIDIDFDSSRAMGKIILVCFWNVEQRPSRNCLIDLAERFEELKDKGIIIAAVHATKNDKETVEDWIKKSSIPFPVGFIQGDTKEILSTWSVESLPWLILTDNKHIIRATGFGINELNQKIGEMANVER